MNKPQHYPNTRNSGIFDAQAFRIGASETVHRPYRFPNGEEVVAECGAYGYAAGSFRYAEWADSVVTCERCSR